jgi:hypothetical protein
VSGCCFPSASRAPHRLPGGSSVTMRLGNPLN